MDSINNSVEALGTLGAWKTIGLVGAVTAMREKVDGVKTSGPITIALVVSLLGGTFAFGGIYSVVKDTKDDTNTAISRLDRMLSESRVGTTAQIDGIMKSANANSALLADAFTRQLDLSHQLFNSELSKRDIKLDIAYESANKGPRYTAAMAEEHEDADNAHYAIDDARYYETRERLAAQQHQCDDTIESVMELQQMCKDTRKRVSIIESQHSELGYHASGNDK